MVDGHGQVRPHWRRVLAALSNLPPDYAGSSLAEATRRLERVFRDDGARALLPGAPGQGGAWRCDPVPLPLPAAEFKALAEGLAQRARLLEALLADLYGPQELLAEGLIPPELVLGNPAFLRPCRNPGRPARRPLLHCYAADLLRSPDGRWHVLADRTGHALGIGHAQENRRMLARALPHLFQGQQVRPLRPFFDQWQDALQRLAPGQGAAAVALLTSGARHPQWFEHVLLSRELSCALVEPGDLSARGGALFLKTLGGLQKVDVLLRQVEGAALDPLEFGWAGAGVPGLMDAWRHGALQVVNAPGSALAEAPAIGALLPALAPRLLREALRLPAVEAHWLAEPGALAAVQRDPAPWLIRPAGEGSAAPQRPGHMEGAALEALLARLAANPRAFVALRDMAPSVAPCVEGDSLVPHPVVLRLFLLQESGNWHAMPGGLARILEPGQGGSRRLSRRGISKDVWVLSDEGAEIQGPVAQPQLPLAIRRATGDLPSRVADNLFWLGRHVERVEGAARLMRAALNRLERGPLLPREVAELDALFAALRRAGLAGPEDLPAGGSGRALQAALWRDLQGGGVLARGLDEIARLVEAVRDRLTGDMHALFTLPLRAVRIQAEARQRGLQGLEEVLGGVLRYSAGVAGVAAENMVRAGGYAFLDLGRRVERAQSIAAQVGIALSQPSRRIEGGLRLALELCDSVITYRSRYLGTLQPAPALDLVLADPGNPRGLLFQLRGIHRHLLEIGEEGALLPVAEALIGTVEAMPPTVLAAPDQSAAAAALAPRLLAIEGEIAALSDAITRRYFALLPSVQALGAGMEGRA